MRDLHIWEKFLRCWRCKVIKHVCVDASKLFAVYYFVVVQCDTKIYERLSYLRKVRRDCMRDLHNWEKLWETYIFEKSSFVVEDAKLLSMSVWMQVNCLLVYYFVVVQCDTKIYERLSYLRKVRRDFMRDLHNWEKLWETYIFEKSSFVVADAKL